MQTISELNKPELDSKYLLHESDNRIGDLFLLPFCKKEHKCELDKT